ncbi:MAG: MarR family transcriptional regulator, partial [Aquihabitans sp.]
TDIAERLHLRLHSVGELVARAEAADLIEREADPDDARRVLLAVSPTGQVKLDKLSRAHRNELRQFRTRLAALLAEIG